MMNHSIKNYHRKLGWFIYPFAIVFGLGVILINFPFSFVPDLLEIANYSKSFELFNLIISSLVTLIGIYVSVSLVAYEFFKQKSGIDFQKSFLISRLNAYFISFTISTIIWVFIVSLKIPLESPNNKEITLIYYCAILFLLIMLVFIPVAFKLFSSLKPNKVANEELEKLSGESIFVSGLESDDIDEQIEVLENDHLLKVTNIVLALISVSDIIKAQAIIFKTSQKILEILINEKTESNKKYITDQLISFYIKVVNFVMPLPNGERILESIWYSVGNLYETTIERHLSTVHLSNFRENFFPRYFNRLFEFNKEEVIIDGVKTISSIIENQALRNLPKDDLIYAFNHFREKNEEGFVYPEHYSKEDHHNNEKWKEVGVELVELFSLVINKSISTKKTTILDCCFEEINRLSFNLYYTKIGKYKQFFFFINTAIIICDCTFRAYEKEVYP